MLRQVGAQEWETTVLLDDTNPACSGVPKGGLSAAADESLAGSARPLAADAPAVSPLSAAYWILADTGPNTETAGETVVVEREPEPDLTTARLSPATANSSLTSGSSCEVTVAFAGLRQVPQTATLVLDEPGASSSIPLTVSRDVTLWYYLGIPAITGGMLALLTLLLSIFSVRRNSPVEPRSSGRGNFWTRPITASGAWTLNDSWATNITSGLVVVGTVLVAATAVNSLFPGVSLDRFAIVNIIAGVIVVAAPVVFGILYAQWTRRNPGVPSDGIALIPDEQDATISVTSGATITMLGDAAISMPDSAGLTPVRSGCAIQVPPGGTIVVPPGASMTAPGGTDISVHATRPITVEGISGTVTIAASDVLPAHAAASGTSPPAAKWSQIFQHTVNPPGAEAGKTADTSFEYPVQITARGGAKITAIGVADVVLPRATRIQSPWGRAFLLRRARPLLTPMGSNMIAANLIIVLITALVTTFGIGAEIGIAGVLSFGLSEADLAWRSVMLGGTVIVGVLVLWYSVTAIGALADPQPGSSMSSRSGDSFTL